MERSETLSNQAGVSRHEPATGCPNLTFNVRSYRLVGSRAAKTHVAMDTVVDMKLNCELDVATQLQRFHLQTLLY